MRILVVGDRHWPCPELAEKIVSRLLARYGTELLIVHGGEQGVDAAVAVAAEKLGVRHEARLVSRHHTGVPTIGAKNRELMMARPDLCVAIHQAIRRSTRTRDCVCQALQEGIPTYLIENEWAIPIRLKTRDKRLG
jgi:hypothetical protein